MAGAGIARQYASAPAPRAIELPALAQRVGGGSTKRMFHAGRIPDATIGGDDNAHRDQILAAVVLDRDGLVRRRARAHELRRLHIRLLVAPVAGPIFAAGAGADSAAISLRAAEASLARFSLIPPLASCRAAASGAGPAAIFGESFQTVRCGRSRKNATPITPTLSGRPVRVAYASGSSVK
jgi:hypothetical protein